MALFEKVLVVKVIFSSNAKGLRSEENIRVTSNAPASSSGSLAGTRAYGQSSSWEPAMTEKNVCMRHAYLKLAKAQSIDCVPRLARWHVDRRGQCVLNIRYRQKRTSL